jgi:hypothetical protein
MVSTKILKLHELETLEDYFNHILLNEINGNRGDVRKLIKDLSKEQKWDCMDFLKPSQRKRCGNSKKFNY